VVAVNRAVALALARSPEAGIEALDELQAPPGYYLLQATRGHLLALAGRPAEAAVETRRALMMCRNEAVRAYLQQRIDALERATASRG
jgi:RNA polymerase sigma-70 factor (ECF subfamily)